MPSRYAELLSGGGSGALAAASWLADVDEGFYAACYLRAWALETHWRAALRERLGESWFESAAAGEWLRGLWRHGSDSTRDELLAETRGRGAGLRGARRAALSVAAAACGRPGAT